MNASINLISGTAVPVQGNDVDTDRIFPARFMKHISFMHLGQYAFYDERFGKNNEKKEHAFNNSKYSKAKILIVNKNFGCGSSREHAPQSLKRFGIDAIIGESFAQIFSANCTVVGIPLISLPEKDVKELMDVIEKNPETIIEISLNSKKVKYDGIEITFFMPEHTRNAFVKGYWNMTYVMLKNMEKIKKISAELPYMHNFVEK